MSEDIQFFDEQGLDMESIVDPRIRPPSTTVILDKEAPFRIGFQEWDDEFRWLNGYMSVRSIMGICLVLALLYTYFRITDLLGFIALGSVCGTIYAIRSQSEDLFTAIKGGFFGWFAGTLPASVFANFDGLSFSNPSLTMYLPPQHYKIVTCAMTFLGACMILFAYLGPLKRFHRERFGFHRSKEILELFVVSLIVGPLLILWLGSIFVWGLIFALSITISPLCVVCTFATLGTQQLYRKMTKKAEFASNQPEAVEPSLFHEVTPAQNQIQDR